MSRWIVAALFVGLCSACGASDESPVSETEDVGGGRGGGGSDTGIARDVGGGGGDTGTGDGTCGDGTLDADEACDDGNTMDGDGCAADCTLEGGAPCDPCLSADDCLDEGAACVTLADGDVCVAPCVDRDCIDGFRCSEIDGDDVCVPEAGHCRETGDVEACAGGVDEDGDGLTDCDDPDCEGTLSCAGGGEDAEICDDGDDNDGDGDVDCDDADCAADTACAPDAEICDNDRDDDGDSLVDCIDEDCADDPACVVDGERCTGGADDDGDGLVDCADPDCSESPACAGAEGEICDNGLDDDADGRTDCLDTECADDEYCSGTSDERCTGGFDEDGDDLVDCDDPDCAEDIACVDPCDALDTVDGFTSWTGATIAGLDRFDIGCGFEGTNEIAVTWTPDASGAACVSTEGTDFDTVLAVWTDCGDADSEIDCNDDALGLVGASELDLSVTAETAYTVIVEGFGSDDGGAVNLTFTSGTCDGSAPPEVCDNEIDDDGDDSIDCDDPDCAASIICTGPPPTCDDAAAWDGSAAVSGTLAGTTAVGDPSCTAGGTGPEAVYAFDPASDGEWCIEVTSADFDSVLYVHATCGDDASEVACNDDGGSGTLSQLSVTTTGEPLFVFIDGWDELDVGAYTLSATEGECAGPPSTETSCTDGVDNDGDFATDCFDSDCEGDPACGVGEGDTCADPIEVSGAGAYTGAFGLFTSTEAPSAGCAGFSGPEVVYAFTPDASGTWCASTAGSEDDTVLYARSTCSDGGSELACDDDTTGLQSEIEFTATSGVPVYLFVDSNTLLGSPAGDYTLTVSSGACP